jgi:dihydrolipoamide dehydrogenase
MFKKEPFMVVGDVTTAVDVLVLGAGPAGYVAAIRAVQLGRQVTLVDAGQIGGTCLHRGCIPLKALVSAGARYASMQAPELAAMGLHAESVAFDWPTMQQWKQGVVDRLADGVRRLLAGHHVELVHGKGWFINAQELRVEGEHGSLRFKFEHCIIATGASARPLESVEGVAYDGAQVLTPEQALALPTLPTTTLAIFGSDYIALELATLFARLGVQVKLYVPGEQLLAHVDAAALRLVQAGLRRLGVQVQLHSTVSAISERPLVIANGVCPNTSALHLDAAGVQLDERLAIQVDSMQRSSVSNIYAVGDCTAERALATIAMKQAKVAAEVIAGQRVQFAPLVTPWVVHTVPELATIGYSAEEAQRAGYMVVQGRFPLAANGRALTLAADSGVALIVANAEDGVLLGGTLVGPQAGDLVAQLALAIEMGATLTDLSEILYAHPSLSEQLLEGAEHALGHAIHVLERKSRN